MGNWKLNGTKESVTALVNALKAPAAANPKVEVAVSVWLNSLLQVQH